MHGLNRTRVWEESPKLEQNLSFADGPRVWSPRQCAVLRSQSRLRRT